jgi:hypothetical protein
MAKDTPHPVTPHSTAYVDDVAQVLAEAFPIEADFVGPTTLKEIAAGQRFAPVEGGSHFDFNIVISTLSCAATIAQVFIAARPPRAATAPALPANFDQQLRAMITEQATSYPELLEAFKRDGQLLDRLSAALKRLITKS